MPEFVVVSIAVGVVISWVDENVLVCAAVGAYLLDKVLVAVVIAPNP